MYVSDMYTVIFNIVFNEIFHINSANHSIQERREVVIKDHSFTIGYFLVPFNVRNVNTLFTTGQ